MGVPSLVNYINAYNGRKQCTVSVYAFQNWKNNKPHVQSALIDALYYKNIPEIMLDHLKALDLSSIKYVARYDGRDIDIMVPLGCIVPNLKEEVKLAREIVDIPFSTKTWNLLLWSRTWNPKTKKYVIEVHSTDKIDDLPILASKPIKRGRKQGTIIRRLYK